MMKYKNLLINLIRDEMDKFLEIYKLLAFHQNNHKFKKCKHIYIADQIQSYIKKLRYG